MKRYDHPMYGEHKIALRENIDGEIVLYDDIKHLLELHPIQDRNLRDLKPETSATPKQDEPGEDGFDQAWFRNALINAVGHGFLEHKLERKVIQLIRKAWFNGLHQGQNSLTPSKPDEPLFVPAPRELKDAARETMNSRRVELRGQSSELNQICENCGHRFGEHSNETCPIGAKGWRASGRYNSKPAPSEQDAFTDIARKMESTISKQEREIESLTQKLAESETLLEQLKVTK